MLVLCIFTTIPLMAQDNAFTEEVAVAPLSLERISWGAIAAGTVVALIFQLLLNLLAIDVGASTLNSMSDESASAGEVTRRTVISMAVIMLGSLFMGGWVAARMAGSPEAFDGLLHGIVVWCLVILISTLLLTTAAGRLFSGVNQLLTERGGMSPEEAENTVQRWEKAVQQAPQKAASVLNDARVRVEDTQRSVTNQVDKIQHDVEQGARQLAQSATDTLAKVAMAAFIVVLIGAASAGAGGYIGAPQEIPTAELENDSDISIETVPTSGIQPTFEVTPTPLP